MRSSDIGRTFSRSGRMIAGAFCFWLLFADKGHGETCPNGASPPKAEWCNFFVEYVPRGQRAVDPRISSRFDPPAPGAPEIRSFAFVISISEYPELVAPKASDLVGVRKDLPNIIQFLKEQQFDEIIVIKEGEVTPQLIRDIFDLYLFRQIKANQNRSRFFFAYDGHGARSLDPSLQGGLALRTTRGDGDLDPDNSFSLEELALKLKQLATFSYQSLALLGSCYSGGALFPERGNNDNSTYSLKPGAHVVAAARPEELAISYPDGHGTVFFDAIIRAIRGSKEPEVTSIIDSVEGTVVQNGAIVRLGRVVVDVNTALEMVPGQPYPQLRISEMAPNKDYEGAFFFLINQAPTVTRVASAAPNQGTLSQISRMRSELVGSNLIKTASIEGATGSSLEGRPNIAVFNVPETYRIRGVDLSRFNGAVDFDILRKNDMRFAYLRATQGKSRVDPTYRTYREAAAKAGLMTGAYHVFSFCTPAAEQMAALAKVVLANEIDLPIAIDVEWVETASLRGGESCNSIPAIKARLLEFARLIELSFGKRPVIYSNVPGMRSLIDTSFDRYPLWIASYSATSVSTALPLAGSNPWTLWQFTEKAKIPGIAGQLDVSAFFGSEDQFQIFKSGMSNIALGVTQKPAASPN